MEPRLRIGEWCFDPSSFELERIADGARQRLPHRLGRLLARLAETPGQVVTREALIGAAWDRRGVADDVLSRSVNALRDALGDDARAPAYVETIPKSGYRLVATVAAEAAAGVQVEAPATPAPTHDGSSIARIVAIAAALAVLGTIAWLSRGSREATAPPSPALDLARERPITSAPGWELGPALSPDAALLAYTEADTPEGPSRLVVSELDGRGRRVLIESASLANARPAFAPSGRELAYRRLDGERCDVVVASVVTGDARRVATCAPLPFGLAWSPDGTRIAYTAPASDGFAPGLALVRVGDGAVTTLTQPSLAEGPDTDPQFVPGASRVSFVRGTASDRALHTVDLEPPHAQHALYAGANLIHGHAWRADGAALVLATDAPGYRALVAFEPSTGRQTTLGARGARFPAVAGNGLVVYELAHYDANVWRVALDEPSAPPVRLTTSSRYDASPSISPDARRFAFVSIRDGPESVWIGSVDGPDETRVPLPRESRWVRPHWHPDGESLLVTAYEDGATRAYRHVLASGRTVPLPVLGEAFGARDTDDGRAQVFARREARGYALFLSRDGAAPARIDGADAVDEFHLDGADLAYTRLGVPGIVVRTLDGGPARSLLPDAIDASNRYAWTLAGGAIYYAARGEDGTARLHRHDLADGTQRVLATASPDAAGASVAVDRAGRIALYARVDELTIDLMAVPLR